MLLEDFFGEMRYAVLRTLSGIVFVVNTGGSVRCCEEFKIGLEHAIVGESFLR